MASPLFLCLALAFPLAASNYAPDPAPVVYTYEATIEIRAAHAPIDFRTIDPVAAPELRDADQIAPTDAPRLSASGIVAHEANAARIEADRTRR